MPHPYRGIKAIITTKHRKETLIAGSFSALEVNVLHYEWDTDSLGTFSGEIPRLKSQRDTALTKARVGMSAVGIPFGIASEGSIGADPFMPFLNSAVEAIAWIDEVNAFELVEFHRDLEVVAVKGEFRSGDSYDEFLKRADFPNHGLIVYPKTDPKRVRKGVVEIADLERAIKSAAQQSNDGLVVLESDLRAHMSPSRQLAITRCAERLVSRLQNCCQECGAPGFGVIDNLYGLLCEQCGATVDNAVRGSILGCVRCSKREERLSGRNNVRAANCGYCNP